MMSLAKKAVQCSMTIKVNTHFISCLILINVYFYYNTCLLLHNIMLIYCAEFDIKSLQIINIFEYIVGPNLCRAFIETVDEQLYS